MANHASHAALPYPIKGARYTILVPMLDADGDPVAATTPDTEISEDNAAATDAAEEISATSGMDGMAMITFSGAETDCSTLAVNFKNASGPKYTLATIYPRVLAEVGTGTLSAGSAGGGTLGTLLAYDVTGCFIKTTGGTGGGGTGGANNQVRKMVTYNTSSGAFTVTPNWETTPSTDTTYAVLLPEGVTLGMLKTLNPTTAGRTLTVESDGMAHADAKEWLGGTIATPTVTGVPEVDVTHFNGTAGTFSSGRPEVNTSHIGGSTTPVTNIGVVFNTDFATNYNTTLDQWNVNVESWNATAVPAEHTAGYPIVTIKDGTGTGEINTNAGAIALVDLVTTTTTVTNQLTAAQIATGVWQDSTAGDFTVASSIGKTLYIANVTPGGSGGLLISGSNAGTTTFGALTVTGAATFTGNVSMAAGLNITQSSSNTSALVVTGNGTGHGAIFTSGSGATGNAFQLTAASTNGHGFNILGTGTGDGLHTQGGASGDGLHTESGGTGEGIHAIGGATSGRGAFFSGPTFGTGATFQGSSSQSGLYIGGGATGPGLNLVGGGTSGNALNATTTDGHAFNLDATGTSKVSINAPDGITANITGTLDTVTTLTNLPAITANWLTAAGTAADFGTEVGTAVWASATRTLTAGTNIQLPSNGLDNVTLPANIITATSIAANAITDAKIAMPAEASGRPTTFLAACRRAWEWSANKRTRNRTTGVVALRNAADDGNLETQTQSTSGVTDTQTQGS